MTEDDINTKLMPSTNKLMPSNNKKTKNAKTYRKQSMPNEILHFVMGHGTLPSMHEFQRYWKSIAKDKHFLDHPIGPSNEWLRKHSFLLFPEFTEI